MKSADTPTLPRFKQQRGKTVNKILWGGTHKKRVSVHDTHVREPNKGSKSVLKKTLWESSENMTQTFHFEKKWTHTEESHT